MYVIQGNCYIIRSQWLIVGIIVDIIIVIIINRSISPYFRVNSHRKPKLERLGPDYFKR